MKVTINTKNREYKEEYLKKETDLNKDELNNLIGEMLSNTYGYIALKIHDICGNDRANQLRMVNNASESIRVFLDAINKAE